MLQKVLVGIFAVALLAGAGFGQDKPNLSGTWKLNVAKSDFGPVPGPTSQTDVIDQNGQTIKVNVSAEGEQGKNQYSFSYVTDGKEVTVSPDAPAAHPAPEVTMQAISSSWDGAALVVHQKLTYGSDPVTGVSRYTLSADGKVLTIASDYSTAMGDASRTFVFDKVDPSSAAAPMASEAAPSSMSSSGSSSSASSSSSMSASASASSSAKPNLSGTWTLDISKSDLGQMPAPDMRTDIIDHKDPSFKVTVNQSGGPMGPLNFTLNAVTDGKTVTTWTGMETEAKSTAHWEGNTLVTQTNSTIQNAPVSFVSKYTLGADGNTLNVQSHFSGPMGDGDAKLVYTKK